MLNILVRGFFGLYWIFDNLNILSKIKILSFDNKQMAKTGATFWLLALLTNLILLLKNFKDLLEKSRRLKTYLFTEQVCTILHLRRGRGSSVRRTSTTAWPSATCYTSRS